MYFAFLFILTAFIFKNAFLTYFFNDDFFFLKISRIDNIQKFVNFFSPIRHVSYKPVSQEIFYFLTHLFNDNVYLAHLLIFLVYFIGLYYLYKIILNLTKNKSLSYLSTFFYAINFTHVFQLYYLATFQDVAIFTFLCLAFYNYLKGNKLLSLIFFPLALLSKETAVLFVPFLILFKFIRGKKTNWSSLISYVALGLVFIFLYQYSLKYVTSLDNYRIIFNPRLVANNALWYLLWSFGAPNFTSLYFTSILKPPIPEFWKMLSNFPEIKIYFLLLTSYWTFFIISSVYFFVKKIPRLRFASLEMTVGALFVYFFIFLGPILFFEHRWMVRLAVPLIFIVLIQSFFILRLIEAGKMFRFIGYVLIGLYFIIQLYGIPIHESSSTFILESRFTKNAKAYFDKNKKEIVKHKYIYFVDKTKIVPMPWGGSEKLKVTLSDQNFLDHYFQNENIKAIYGFENKKIPPNSYIINSFDILLHE